MNYSYTWSSALNYITKLFLLLLPSLIFVSCGNDDLPQYWPSNGTIVKNIKWEIPFSDSLNILSRDGNLWKLPSVPDSISAETLYTTHRKPQLHNYDEILGRVDQEIVQSKNTAIVEFYRFEKGSAYLVGYTNPDSTKPFTIIDPPLLIMPENINELKEAITSAGTSKDWIRDSLVEGYKTTFTISKKESGSFITENQKKNNAVLCEMVITQDAGVAYGETNLILPNAVTMKSNVLISEEKGTMLEWGIRSRKLESENNETEMPERELYIEITWRI